MAGITIGVILSDRDDTVESTEQALARIEKEQIEEQAGFVLGGREPMTIELSEKWGKLALKETNELRTAKDLDALAWSNQLHTIAYQRNKEVSQGIIDFDDNILFKMLS